MTSPPDGEEPPSPYPRMVRRIGDPAPLVMRARGEPLIDFYHRILALPLSGVLVLMACAFVAINLVFTALYLAIPDGVANLERGDVWNAFFFSVQTFGTIGYGYMYPQSFWANLVMTCETFAGLVYVAMATGLVFARVSRPTARVDFSRTAVVHLFEGVPTLMFRAANRRANQILEAEVMVTLARDVTTAEGRSMRRFDELKVLRARSPLFAFTWTVMHPIGEDSPLLGATRQTLARERAEIVVVLSGVDDRYAQRVHARHSYTAGEVVFDRRFADVLSLRPDGRRMIDYRRFHELEDL